MLSTITRDPVITSRIRACKAMIKREAAVQAERRVLLSLPHDPGSANLMHQRDCCRLLISALLDTYLTLRGKPTGHLRKKDWRNSMVLRDVGFLIDAEVLPQDRPAV